MMALAPSVFPALSASHRRRDTCANGFAQGDEGLADGGGTEGQGREHQHHAIQDHAQRAALFGRLDHATGHIVQGGQQDAMIWLPMLGWPVSACRARR